MLEDLFLSSSVYSYDTTLYEKSILNDAHPPS